MPESSGLTGKDRREDQSLNTKGWIGKVVNNNGRLRDVLNGKKVLIWVRGEIPLSSGAGVRKKERQKTEEDKIEK